MAFTTDSFVVKPLFFLSGNVGKLAVYGTINGKFVKEPKETVFIENYFGGKRILAPLDGNMLPRIC